MNIERSSGSSALVLLLLGAIAAGCGSTSGHGSAAYQGGGSVSAAATAQSYTDYGLSLVNDARAAQGLPLLILDSGLSAVAVRHSNELAASTPVSGFAASAHQAFLAGDTGGATAENQGYWGPGAQDADFKTIFDQMMAEGPPAAGTINHYSNIMNPAARLIGIGVLYDATQTLWVSEEFE